MRPGMPCTLSSTLASTPKTTGQAKPPEASWMHSRTRWQATSYCRWPSASMGRCAAARIQE
eukprot:8178460-Lingulodinium_polyedra.AAC.1